MVTTPATRLGPADPDRAALVCSIGVSIALKAVFLAVVDVPVPVRDAVGYLQRARVLSESGVFGMTAAEPDVANAPFYSIVLSPFVALQGPVPALALAAQCLLSLAVVSAAWWLGSRLGGRAGGWGAGLLSATYPPLTAYPFLFLTETVAIAQFLAALVLVDLLLAGGDRPARPGARLGLSALLGALMAIASLTRVVMFPLILVPLSLVAYRFRRTPRQAVALIATGLLAFGVVYGPWVVRNWQVTGRLIVLNDRYVEQRLAAHRTARFLSHEMTFVDARRATNAERRGSSPAASEVAPPAITSVVFWQDSAQRLAIMLGVHPRVETPFPLTGSTTEGRPLVRAATYGWHALLALATAAASFICWRRRDFRLAAMLLLPGALMATYALVHAIPRYQIVPFSGLTVPAGVAIGVGARRAARKGSTTGRARE